MIPEYRILDARTNREVAEVTKKWLALADTCEFI
jgi:hypothetical protein